MKIKKYLTVGLSLLVITSMVGCSSSGVKIEESKDTNTSQNTSSENEKSDDITYFGKVKSIVGNEVEIDLAKEQDVNGNDSKLPDGTVFKESIGGESGNIGEELKPITDNSGGSYKDSVQIDGEGEAEAEGLLDLEELGNDKKLELEYTGETIKVTIPTGANIFDMRSGSDSKLSAIKINSVIRISAKGTKESPIIKGIEIVE